MEKALQQHNKYLFNLYRKVPLEEVKKKETEIRSMIFNPANPMILLFNPIEKLYKMADSAEITYTKEQILDIGLTMIHNTWDFEKSLVTKSRWCCWKTWDKLKSHFKDVQKQLKAIRGPTMQQVVYHHANHLAQQLHADIEQHDYDLLT